MSVLSDSEFMLCLKLLKVGFTDVCFRERERESVCLSECVCERESGLGVRGFGMGNCPGYIYIWLCKYTCKVLQLQV